MPPPSTTVRRIDHLAGAIATGLAANPRVYAAWQMIKRENRWTDNQLRNKLAKEVYRIAAALEAESQNN